MKRARHYRRRRLATRRARRGSLAKPLCLFVVTPLVIAVAVTCLGAVGATVGYYNRVRASMKSPDEVIAERGGGARIYDRNGTLLYEFLDDRYGRQVPVKLADVSPLIQNATIAAEDASFFSNPGVNVKGLARAGLENLRPSSFLEGTGGSSITQQLVKQIYFTPEQRQQRSLSRKLKEAVFAVEVTRNYSKQQILEWYLNEIPYGGVLTGVEAASEGYFGISANDVDLAQAAFLAGLPQSPSRYDPFTDLSAAIGREQEVLNLMAEHGFISQKLADWAKLESIELHPKAQPFLAPHFVLYVGDYIKATLGEDALLHGGLDVWTTLDLQLNTKANEMLEQNLQKYEATSNGHNGAVVIIDPPTAQILAMVGSRDYARDDIDGRVNDALALRSPGSTLKPFTYATAFMQGWGPEWPIIDTPITYTEADGKPFTPRNPDGRFHGTIPLKQALGNSFNIPAFKTILWDGVDNMIHTAKTMGITTLDVPLGPAVTLGGSDVKLLDMVYGYSTFANNGVMVGAPTTLALPDGNRKLDPISVLQVKNRSGQVLLDNTEPSHEYVMKPAYAYMITDILSNDQNRQITYGRGSNLNIPGWRVAAKTGTSEPFENSKAIGDTWTYGYTPDIAVGVWVGNSDYAPMLNIFSTTIAGATWHDIMVEALAGRTPRDWVKPDGLEQATVCVPSGLRVQPGMSCRSVTGTFATEALDRQNDHWWGGQLVSATIDPRTFWRVPDEITGWKRKLAAEYLGYYGGRSTNAEATPTETLPPSAAVPATPPPTGNVAVVPTPQPGYVGGRGVATIPAVPTPHSG